MLDVPIAEAERGISPNLRIGIPDNEHDYLSREVRSGYDRPKGHHYRPPCAGAAPDGMCVVTDRFVPACLRDQPVVEGCRFFDRRGRAGPAVADGFSCVIPRKGCLEVFVAGRPPWSRPGIFRMNTNFFNMRKLT